MRFKVSLLVLLVLLCSNLFALEEGPGFFVEYGMGDFTTVTVGEDAVSTLEYNEDCISFTELEVHYVFKFWELELIPYGDMKTWFIADSNILKGQPFCDIYTVGAKVVWGNVSGYYEHYCAHPVHSGEDNWKVRDYRLGQNADVVGIRYSYN